MMESLVALPVNICCIWLKHAVFVMCSYEFDLRSWITTCAKPPHTLTKQWHSIRMDRRIMHTRWMCFQVDKREHW